MAEKPAAAEKGEFIKSLFRDRQSAERAFNAALELGYEPADINVVMSDKTRQRWFSDASESELARKADSNEPDSAADKVGGPVGGTVGTIAPAVAAIGTVLLIPGIVAAGPIAVALVAAGATGVAGGLIGALTRWGVSSAQIEEYEASIRKGGILLAVKPRTEEDSKRLIQIWTSLGGESVHS